MDYSRVNRETFEQELITFRRELHKYPESAWTEYRTTVRIIQELKKLGIPFWYGRRLHTTGERNNLPDPLTDAHCMQRAINEIGEETLIKEIAGGYTGVVAFIEGKEPGPTIAIRFDIDCNDVQEELSATHLPVREGFASMHPNLMHACGHDAHTAIGLGTVKLLNAYKDKLKGKVILVFQPAEEGNRGAISMVDAGIFRDLGIDYMFTGHCGPTGAPAGEIAASVKNFAIGYKINFMFKGLSSHAGNAPQEGKNALAAACMAVLGLLGISRSSEGWSRINVGYMQSGTGRNVIPENALLWLEVRGETEAIRDYMYKRALEIGEGAAQMYGCEFSYKIKGKTRSVICDEELVSLVEDVAKRAEGVTTVSHCSDNRGGGDDVTHILNQVQEGGGLVDYIQFGAGIQVPHHNCRFDIDEAVIPVIARLYCDIVFELNKKYQFMKENKNSND